MSRIITPSKFPEAIGKKTEILCTASTSLDPEKVQNYLTSVPPIKAVQWGQAGYASLFFDMAFSPGIIPKAGEVEYKKAYAELFRSQYGREVFTEDNLFVFQNEAEYYDEPAEGPSSPLFTRDWVANLRALIVLLGSYRKSDNNYGEMRVNLIEAACCHLLELGITPPEDLFDALPTLDQVRLQDIFKQYKGKELAVGELFLICNELEFEKQRYARSTGERKQMVENAQNNVREHIRRTTMSGTLTFADLQKQAARDEAVKSTRVLVGEPNWQKLGSSQKYHVNFRDSLSNADKIDELLHEVLAMQGPNIPNLHK